MNWTSGPSPCLLPAFMFFMISFCAFGQEANFLPLQDHKLLYADTVYREAVRRKDPDLLAEAYYLYGKTYEASGNHETSQRYYFKSLKLLERKGDSPSLSRILHRLGEMEASFGNNEKAERYFRQSLGIAGRIHSHVNLIRGYGTLAWHMAKDRSGKETQPGLRRSNPDSALYYVRKVDSVALRSGDPIQVANAHLGMAGLFWDILKDEKETLRRLADALSIYTDEKKDGGRVATYSLLARYYLETGQLESAWNTLQTAREIYRSNPFHDLGNITRLNELFLHYYRARGNWKRAFEYSEKNRRIQPGTGIEAAYIKMARQYEAEKKEAELREHETELRLRAEALRAYRWLTGTVALLLAALAVLSYVFYRLYKKNRYISQQNEMLLREQNHRVANDLQAISSFLNLQQEEVGDFKARKVFEESKLRVEAIAVLHKKLYQGKRLTMVYLPDFLEDILDNVLHTFGMQHISPDLDIAPLYLPSDQAVPLGLIVNELTTNACKYAYPLHPAPSLRLSCRLTGENAGRQISLIFKDNGLDASVLETLNSRPLQRFGLGLLLMQVRELSGHHRFTYEKGIAFGLSFPEKQRPLSAGPARAANPGTRHP